MFPDKRDPVDPKVNHTTRVFCGAEFHVPLPNFGKDMDDPKKWGCLFSCVDAETMEVRWQCKVSGNMDLVATSYDGKLAAANQYNTEGGVLFGDMMSAERDRRLFDIRAIYGEKAGRLHIVPQVPVVAGPGGEQGPNTSLTFNLRFPRIRTGQQEDDKSCLPGQSVAPRSVTRRSCSKWIAEARVKAPRA